MLCHLSLLTDKIMVPGSIIINDLIIVLKCDSCLHLLASNLGFDVYSIFIGEDNLMRLKGSHGFISKNTILVVMRHFGGKEKAKL